MCVLVAAVVYAWVYQLKAVVFDVYWVVVLVCVARVFDPFVVVAVAVAVVVAPVVGRIQAEMQMMALGEELQG